MAKETSTSQTQQTKPADDGIARLEALFDQVRDFEKQAVARWTEAASRGADLTRTAIDTATKLSEAWRQMAIDAARQGAQLFNQAR